MRKRILSMLLVLTTVLSFVPAFSVTASVADPLPDTETFISGGCDITFTKNADGVTYTARLAASASGNGVMASDTTVGKQPYKAYQPVTTRLVIDNSVVQLGQGCFCGFSGLKEIDWPETLQFSKIPMQSFLNCGLESVEIPEGITSIESTSFISTGIVTSDHMLKRVYLPSTISNLSVSGDYLPFSTTSNSSQVELVCKNQYSYSWAVEHGYRALQDTINKIDGTNVEWSYSTYDKTLTITGSGAIPNYSIENPAPWSQYAQETTALSINGNITGIGDYAFYDFKKIYDVSIPAVTERIGDYAFALAEEDIWNTFNLTLVNFNCEVSSVALNNRTKVNYAGFPLDSIQYGYCGSGSNGTYADNAQFYITTDGKLVIFGNGSTGDMNYNGNKAPWFENRMQITAVEVLDGITKLEFGTLAGLSNLKWENVNITTDVKTYASNLFFASGSAWDVVVPVHITSIDNAHVFGSSASTGKSNIKSITFENPNVSLCTDSATTTMINGGSTDGVTLYYRNNGQDCSVKTFAEKYGYTYSDLDTVTNHSEIPDCNLSYSSFNGETLILSAIDKTKPISVPTSGYWLENTEKTGYSKLILRDGIINIPKNAFAGYSGLTSVTLPNTLASIGSGAFSVTGSVPELALEIPHSVSTIADDAFSGRTITLRVPGESPVADYQAAGVTVIRTFKVLFVGNSFSVDASWGNTSDYSQTWRVFDSLMEDDVELTIALAQNGGIGLGWHATNDRAGKFIEEFSVAKYSSNIDGKWTYFGDFHLSDAFAYEEWDVISLQNNGESVENRGTGASHVAEDLRPLSASIPYLLDRIQEKSPSAKVYMYTVWQYTPLHDTIKNVLVSTNYGFMNRITLSETTETYTSTDGKLGITGTVPAATAIQNARSTYLATLSNVGMNISTTNDNVMGLQRDIVHLSYSMGRYIVGLTFAKTVIPNSLLKEGAVDAGPRASYVIGEMPAEYVEIARAAVDAAITNPKTLTLLSGYTDDPAVTAQTALNGTAIAVAVASSDVSENTITTALNEKLASDLLRNSLSIKTLEDGLKLAVKDGTLVCNNGEYSATVTVQYGYTFMETTISGHIHSMTETEAKKATRVENGHNAYWTCGNCDKAYSDAGGTNEISDLDAWKTGAGKIPATGHGWGISTLPPGCDREWMHLHCIACLREQCEPF